MKIQLRHVFAAVLAGAAVAALAQGGPGPGPGPGASAPRGAMMGSGAGMGPGAGMMGPGAASSPRGGMMGRGGRYGADYTPGWSMMTPEERNAHRDAMLAQKDYAECRTLMEQHHQQMAERAKAQGWAMPARPRHDGCAGLKR